VLPPGAGAIVRDLLRSRRRLDRGNATSTALLDDYGGFGMAFWTDLGRHDRHSARRKERLDTLNAWRNAIAHRNSRWLETHAATMRTLRQVRAWRGNCSALAHLMDRVVGRHLTDLIGERPW
jgi:hypothetical protein